MYRWYFGLDKMAVLLSRVISGIQDLETCDIDEKHASTQYVTSMIRGERNTRAGRNKLVG